MPKIRRVMINFIHDQASRYHPWKIFYIPGLALLFGSVVIGIIYSAVWLDNRLELEGPFVFPFNLLLAVPVLAAGLLLVTWCNLLFIKAKGSPVPLHPPKVLVVKGPYALTRNPMITGVFLLLTGMGIIYNSVIVVFVLSPLFILVAAVELKWIEEPELEKRLGDDYVRYRQQTPMFFPGLHRRHNKER